MPIDEIRKLEELVSKVRGLTGGQALWIERVLNIFQTEAMFECHSTDLFDTNSLEMFGDALRIHHCFSVEPFSKDKFEYVLQRTLEHSGRTARLAPKGNPGHDITIDDVAVSLKTQANRDIKSNVIWISKYMELGRGVWNDDVASLTTLHELFLKHMRNYDRIFTLRNLRRSPDWYYELVEIPKQLLTKSVRGEFEMKFDSSQNPKPGYCHVRNSSGQLLYELYFDGGTERKLQIKNLRVDECTIHATWQFTIPPEQPSSE